MKARMRLWLALGAMVLAAGGVSAQTAWSVDVEVTDGDAEVLMLTFGLHADATDGFDAGLESDLPPGGALVSFPVPGTFNGSATDLRDVGPVAPVTWSAEIQAGGTYPITFAWDSRDI